MLIGTVVMMIYNSGILTITTILSSLVGFVFITIIMKNHKNISKNNNKTWVISTDKSKKCTLVTTSSKLTTQEQEP